jgi:hypothetical protein
MIWGCDGVAPPGRSLSPGPFRFPAEPAHASRAAATSTAPSRRRCRRVRRLTRPPGKAAGIEAVYGEGLASALVPPSGMSFTQLSAAVSTQRNSRPSGLFRAANSRPESSSRPTGRCAMVVAHTSRHERSLEETE